MKSKITILIAGILIIIITILMIDVNGKRNSGQTNESDQWSLVWSDEFNGDSINEDNWSFDIGGGGWGNKELEYYTDRKDNVRTEDGNLIIEAKKEQIYDYNYTSARLTTKNLQTFTYGKIEARIRLPKEQGLWPAFWMVGCDKDTIDWPKCGEIDIMEQINKENLIYGSAHYFIDDSTLNFHKQETKSKSQIDVTDYHTYSIEWDDKKIQWFVDDIKYYEIDITDKEAFHKPFYMMLNLAIGGKWPGDPDETTNLPAKMYVDYIRVYKNNNMQ